MSKSFPTTARALTREIFSVPDSRLVEILIGNQNTLASWATSVVRDVMGHLPSLVVHSLKQIKRRAERMKNFWTRGTQSGIEELDILVRRIESLDVIPRRAEWSGYYSGQNELPVYDGRMDTLDVIRKATPKHATIDMLLNRISPSTVLDIGCNRGLFAQLAALRGARVVGIDTDEFALDQMYRDSVSLNTNVLPLFINAVAPAEAVGFREIPFPSVMERLRSDCVLCLALIHHLVFKETRMTFPHIAKMLSSYSKKYVILEFIPREDNHLKQFCTDEIDWYSLDNLRSALSVHFREVEIFESFPSPRVLLLCEK
jgi:SAM-dependent methyltransferase